MQWRLVLLVLMGQFSSCHRYQYHFIGENRTWGEAQTFCRETYTDLATVSDMTDVKRLRSSAGNQGEAWIGLHSYPGKNNRKWYWSLPGLEFNNSDARWNLGQPNDANGVLENCETNQSSHAFYSITTPMTWPQAQSHCRQNYTDLVSGLDQLDDDTVKNQSKVWIGLFRDTWRWSDGTNSSFRNWQSLENMVDGQSNKACATVLNPAGTWSFDFCDELKPFYCYDANPRNGDVVKVNLSADPALTMTDLAVTESVLKQMEAAFTDKGLSVKLSWRKRPEKLTTTEEERQRQDSIDRGCSVFF